MGCYLPATVERPSLLLHWIDDDGKLNIKLQVSTALSPAIMIVGVIDRTTGAPIHRHRINHAAAI